MKRKQGINSAVIFALLGIAALLFALDPTSAVSQTCGDESLVDSDSDGFTDYWECTGIPLTGGASILPTSPTKKDLFVILVRATPSNIPADSFDPFALAKNLGINIQVIEPNQVSADRVVSSKSFQKAVKITEDLSTSVSEVGSSTPGIPSGRDEAKIYTNRIKQKLIDACPCLATDTCGQKCIALSGESGLDALLWLYTQNIIAHELGHMVSPVKQPYTTLYEYHYQEGTTSPSIMDRAIVSTKNKKTGIVTIPISKVYKQADKDAVRLVP